MSRAGGYPIARGHFLMGDQWINDDRRSITCNARIVCREVECEYWAPGGVQCRAARYLNRRSAYYYAGHTGDNPQDVLLTLTTGQPVNITRRGDTYTYIVEQPRSWTAADWDRLIAQADAAAAT